MRVFKLLDDYVENFLSFLFYLYILAIVFIEVIRRYVFHASSSWGEETAVYAFVWLAYIAAARGVKERSHLSVDLLDRWKGRRGKLVTYIASDVCFFALALLIVYYSALFVGSQITYGQSMSGINLPIALASVAVPVGWSLIMFRVFQRFIKTLNVYAKGEDLHETSELVLTREHDSEDSM